MKRRLLLISIAGVQFLIFSLLGIWVYNKFTAWQKQEQAKKIVRLDQLSLQREPASSLNYYITLPPNREEHDQALWMKEKAMYSYNADGLNDSKNYSTDVKDPDTFRIVTVGDSFTYGHYVNTRENWTELLENSMNNKGGLCQKRKVEVINLGMPGFDVEYIAERYATVGKKYSPDLIVWFEAGSGFTRINEVSGKLIEECQKTVTEEDQKQMEKQGIYFHCWETARLQMIKDHSIEWVQEYIQQRMNRFYESAGETPVAFVTFTNIEEDAQKQLAQWVTAGKGNSVAFSEIPMLSPEHVFEDKHPNPKGHQHLSSAIGRILEEKQEEFCPRSP